jgi:hypothetical protein
LVSEDFDQLKSGFAAVHRLRHVDDLSQPLACEVLASRRRGNATRKALKVKSLCSVQ